MAKLYFNYGVMGAGKSLFLLAKAHNFLERGIPVKIVKPSIDTRDQGVIWSRALGGGGLPCLTILPSTQLREIDWDDIKWILVDEAQFLTPSQVDDLAWIVDMKEINVICYGLRTDFQTHLFPGSARLFEVADSFEEMKSTCECGEKASINARIDEEGKIVTEGEQVSCGLSYVPLCRKCYEKRKEGN